MMSKSLILAGAASLCIVAVQAQAQTQPDGTEAEKQEELVVTGTRLSDSVRTYPGSVSVIGEKDIADQLAVTRDLSKILSFQVPGLAQGNDTAANVEQSLRGRPIRIFIDGIPVSNPLRDGGRDVRLIAPTALAGVEVIRGASSLYGQGGAGGVVNYVTKSGSAGDAWKFRTEVGSSFSTEHFEDSARPFVFQSAQGGLGPFDLNLNGSYEKVNGQFDANGKRLPPDPHLFGGIADSDIFNFYGKLGYSIDDRQRFEVMANYYRQAQDTPYGLVAGNYATGVATSSALVAQDPRALDQVNRNFVSYFAYSNSDIIGSSMRSQVYYLKNYAVFAFEPARLGGTQTAIDSVKYGLQTDFRTKLDFIGMPAATLLWGFDISRDTTEQPLIPLTAIDGRTFTPPLRQTNYAAFAQLDLPIRDWLTVRAGIRHDQFDLRFPDFVAGLTGVRVTGGTLHYDATPVNFGVTLQPAPELQFFAGFAQGFSIPDIGTPLRNARFTTVNGLRPEAAMTNNYETGIRINAFGIRASAAYWFSTSALGTDFIINPAAPTEVLVLRERERIEGVEITIDGKIGSSTRWGGVFSWSEGKRDANRDGKPETPLTGRRISPLLANGYVEHDIMQGWSLRGQVAYSGARNAFPGSPVNNFYTGRVRPTTRVDLSSSVKLGTFDLSLGVSNLLNNDYFSVTSQMLNRNDRFSKAMGRTIFVQVGVDY